MKLFLCSHFSSVGSLIKEEIENKKVAFIPTAGGGGIGKGTTGCGCSFVVLKCVINGNFTFSLESKEYSDSHFYNILHILVHIIHSAIFLLFLLRTLSYIHSKRQEEQIK